MSNFNRVALGKDIESVTICMDNDGKQAASSKAVDKAANTLRLKGIQTRFVRPDREKSDFNDLLIEHGTAAVKRMISQKRAFDIEI